MVLTHRIRKCPDCYGTRRHRGSIPDGLESHCGIRTLVISRQANNGMGAPHLQPLERTGKLDRVKSAWSGCLEDYKRFKEQSTTVQGVLRHALDLPPCH
jgi:hypothetical protein